MCVFMFIYIYIYIYIIYVYFFIYLYILYYGILERQQSALRMEAQLLKKLAEPSLPAPLSFRFGFTV